MTNRLRWRDAVADDISALKAFVCSPPAPLQPFKGFRKPPGPTRPWEHVAQAGVRAMRPPAPPGQMMIVGEDDAGIAAAAWTDQVDGAGDVFAKVMAVALRCRERRDVYYGQELLTELQNRLASRADAAGESSLTITGNVHPKNKVCIALLRRFHWETFDHDGAYEVWITSIPLDQTHG